MITEFLNRVFGQAEEINGRDRCPTYLYRWILLKAGKAFSVYLHHFVGDDWSHDLHDHPKRFILIGLKGWYIETQQLEDGGTRTKLWKAPWFRSFPASHIHRIETPGRSCWTLVIVLRASRQWGFWHGGRFIPWRDYVDGKDSGIADRMRACE